MAQVKSQNTAPEYIVRRLLHSKGYRFRLHRKDLHGKPDIVLPKHKKVIFVHGCFWHGHIGCPRAARPTSNTQFWNKKLDRNVERDARAQEALKDLGWEVLVVWECQTKSREHLLETLIGFLSS
jgi:DNA mismatch endonuclease (patch repair protein)